jgi:hypothetical protein
MREGGGIKMPVGYSSTLSLSRIFSKYPSFSNYIERISKRRKKKPSWNQKKRKR